MKLQVTSIVFDFEMDNEEDCPTEEYQKQLTEGYIGSIWDVDDEEDLTEEISDATGWCIKSIDYRELVLAQSDEFSIEQDDSDFVHFIDGEGTIRLTINRSTLDDLVSQLANR